MSQHIGVTGAHLMDLSGASAGLGGAGTGAGLGGLGGIGPGGIYPGTGGEKCNLVFLLSSTIKKHFF